MNSQSRQGARRPVHDRSERVWVGCDVGARMPRGARSLKLRARSSILNEIWRAFFRSVDVGVGLFVMHDALLGARDDMRA